MYTNKQRVKSINLMYNNKIKKCIKYKVIVSLIKCTYKTKNVRYMVYVDKMLNKLM